MKKILILFFLNLLFYNVGFAEDYYFKECKINEGISADYFINLDKSVIEVNLNNKIDGITQKLQDEIKLITEDQISSKILPSGKGGDNYFQYHLNAKSESVIKYSYKKIGDIFRLAGPIRDTHCFDVKADWDKGEIQEKYDSEQQKEILKTQKKISEEQNFLPKCEGNNFEQWTNCQGSYTDENESKYDGLFQDGKIIKGTVMYPGGGIYIGNFQFAKPNGQGTFTYSDGSIHFGEWKNGKGHGQGIKTWKDGKKYAGEFKDDKPHGQGTFTYPDGSKYKGEYENGKRHGQGTLQYPNGKTYIGKFVNGLEHGQGICLNVNGESVSCKILKLKSNQSSEVSKSSLDISIEAKKWVKISDYESTSGKGKKIMDQLESDFTAKALMLCSSTGNFDVLEKNINVLELDETPAFGTTAKVKLGIVGVIECK